MFMERHEKQDNRSRMYYQNWANLTIDKAMFTCVRAFACVRAHISDVWLFVCIFNYIFIEESNNNMNEDSW